MAQGETASLKDRVHNGLARGILGLALAMPYRMRVPFVGWVVTWLVSPLAGWNRRMDGNLALTMPELSHRERRRIMRAVSDNFGRTLIEIYSGAEFTARAGRAPLEGPGQAALDAARAAGRPIILLTAHFGNYDVIRAKFTREGHPMGALYRPMRNAPFNAHYVRAISRIGTPVFPADARGTLNLVKHLRAGGVIGLLGDVALVQSPVLNFFGQPAHTPMGAAEWALKYDALLLPVFGIRAADGLNFRIRLGAPIDHGEAEAMMQAYNDRLEEIAREFPEQWFWIHKRWKQRAKR